MPRYRFGDFTLSPRRRILLHGQVEQPLIPRYFDLLVFLVERRHEAVHRRDIFDRVWSDVVVSDSALSQAVRTIRRALGDDPREPRFIRTVSRHGYRFVFADVIEENDEAGNEERRTKNEEEQRTKNQKPGTRDEAAFEPLLQQLTGADGEEDQREAAELLHGLGTAEALKRLGTRPNHARARAVLRDTRWEIPNAGPVPILGQPTPIQTASTLVALRLRRAARIAAARWVGASVGAGLAGVAAGVVGGLLLAAAPGSSAPLTLSVVLGVIGGCCGALGGAGVGAGLSAVEASARSRRSLYLIAAGAAGGGLVGTLIEWIARWSLAALVGLRIDVGGSFEGLAIGAAAGLGYALATGDAREGLAAPRGQARLRAVAIVAASCGLGASLVALTGRPLIGGTIHAIAQASQGSQATLTPLAAMVGDPAFGETTRAVLSTAEGALFGLGFAFGLTRRP